MLPKPHIPDFKRVVRRFASIAETTARERVGEFVRSERDGFVRRIEEQQFHDFDITPLSPRYAAWKAKRGLDPRILIRTGHYLRSIRTFEFEGKNGIQYRIGFDSNAVAVDADGHPTSFPLHRLAAVLEYGSVAAHIPRRRHWRPHLVEMKKRAPSVRKRIASEAMRRFKRAFPAWR